MKSPASKNSWARSKRSANVSTGHRLLNPRPERHTEASDTPTVVAAVTPLAQCHGSQTHAECCAPPFTLSPDLVYSPWWRGPGRTELAIGLINLTIQPAGRVQPSMHRASGRPRPARPLQGAPRPPMA